MQVRVMAINLLITAIIALVSPVWVNVSRAAKDFNGSKTHIVKGAQKMSEEMPINVEAKSGSPLLIGGRVLTDCHTRKGRLDRSRKTAAV